MNNSVVRVEIKAVLPSSGAHAVFLGDDEKVFIIYVDHSVGSALTMLMRDTHKQRPLTHDLMGSLLTGLGARVERVIVNDAREGVYYARLIVVSENEVQEKKIIELDARPSDCFVLASQSEAPIYVSRSVWDEEDNMAEVLKKMRDRGFPIEDERSDD
jgi:bifunctional DNase/RNase